MVKPIRDFILVKPFPSDNVSAGGIIVSEAHKAISNKMEVVEVGAGLPNKPMQFKKGQTVFRVQNWGDEVEIDGVKHYLMRQDTVLATV